MNSFMLGAAAGIVLVVGYLILRRVYMRWRLKNMFNNPQALRKHSPKASGTAGSSTGTAIRSKTAIRRNESAGNGQCEQEKAQSEEREAKMYEMLSEMRELVLRLTDIIANTDNASGDASVRFEQARKALENLGDDSDVDIAEVKHILLSEIDRMVKTNEVLKRQLDTAHTGMTSQKQEIDKLKTKASMDTLTQLANRAAFDERLQDVFFQWRHMQVVFSLLMLDVDHFKQINDTHGHVHGDRILNEIAGKIKECIRDDDFAARYGGEEFAIIFPDTPAEEGLAVGTRIRENVERSHFQVDNNPVRITISGGISQSGMAFTPEDIVDVADKALYTSKNKGRNRITLSEDRIKESWTSGEGPISAIPGVES